MNHKTKNKQMKNNQLAWIAIGIVAIGLIISPFTTKSTAQPQRVMAHDVVYLTGSKFLWWSSSSSNAPKFPDFDYTTQKGALIADTTAQLLDDGFIQIHMGVTQDGFQTYQYIRTRPK